MTSKLATYHPILTAQDWEEAYPRETYVCRPIVDERVKRCALHFQIALGQKQETLLKYINENKEKNFQILIQQDSDFFGVTPLHVAVLIRNLPIVRTLVAIFKEKGAQWIDAKDANGWTPMHLAHLVSGKIFKVLSEAGANLQAKTLMGASLEDLDRLIGRKEAEPHLANIFYVTSFQGSVPLAGWSAADFKEKMGLTAYRDLPLFEENVWKVLWQQEPPESFEVPSVHKIYTERVQEWLRTPPRLELINSQELEQAGDPHTLQVIAGEEIASGKVIAPFIGKVFLQQRLSLTSFEELFKEGDYQKVEYSLGNQDSHDIGNIARFLNTGWPNCRCVSVNFNGTEASILFTLRKISKGEPLIFDYGTDIRPLLWGKYQLFGRTNMRQFFSPGLGKLLKEAQAAGAKACTNMNNQTLINLEIYETYFHYLLNCPAAMLDLHFSGILLAGQCKDFLLTENFILVDEWRNVNRYEVINRVALLNTVIQFEQAHQSNPEVAKRAGEWVLGKIGQMTVMQILKAVDLMAASALEEKLTWDSFIRNLENKLEHYQWLDDPEAPLSHNRRLKTVIEMVQNDHLFIPTELYDEIKPHLPPGVIITNS